MAPAASHLYSLIIAFHPTDQPHDQVQAQAQDQAQDNHEADWRLGEITVDWVDFTREKSVDQQEMASKTPGTGTGGGTVPVAGPSQVKKKPGQRVVPGATSKAIPSSNPTSNQSSPSKHPIPGPKRAATPDSLSLQPLLAHFPGPNPLDSSYASGLSDLGRGVVHLFRHAPPASLIASIDSHPVGEGSKSATSGEWDGDRAEGEDGSLIAILAVPAWMRPADFLEFIGGWGTCIEGVRMIREATTPNRSIVLLKFRDPLQASDFLVIFTGRAFSTLDARETCHPIRIHHLILHKLDKSSGDSTVAIPAFPPSVYVSRQLAGLLTDVPTGNLYELPSCPVCLERLDSTVTGLVTLPCAHTFDCDCLRKWGDSRCPVCRISHLLLSSSATPAQHRAGPRGESDLTRLTRCSMCDSTENNWICVVCGAVGCGRYEPQKGHARRHWQESGHVLAMELETQRVWDYKGDNYVHRLIQTRNDGKLVELPSASSLVTHSIPRVLPMGSQGPSQPSQSHLQSHPQSQSQTQVRSHAGTSAGASAGDAGPSSNDVEKMSTIESITLEYSYLLSSQLESMRQHYESQQSSLAARLEQLESAAFATETRVNELEGAEAAREKAERRAEKAVALSRELQAGLQAEKSINQGLVERIRSLEQSRVAADEARKEKEEECKALEETVRDLMFSLEAGMKVQQLGGDGGEGGDLVVVPGKEGKKKKGKR